MALPTHKKPAKGHDSQVTTVRAKKMTDKQALDAQADAEWDRVLAKNPGALAKMAEEALRDFEEGRTEELDPDKL